MLAGSGLNKRSTLFSIVAGPSQDEKGIGKGKKNVDDRHLKRIQFWEGLQPILNENTSLYRNINPTTDYWLSSSTGIGGVRYDVAIRMEDAAIRLSIEKPRAKKLNKEIFNYLLKRKRKLKQHLEKGLNGGEWTTIFLVESSMTLLTVDYAMSLYE